MANSLIPPTPTGSLPGSAMWNDWIEKLRTIVNGIFINGFSWANITGTPTTLAGYGITKVDTTGDVIVDNNAKGLVLQSPNLHYWRATISNTGVVTWTDLGTTKP